MRTGAAHRLAKFHRDILNSCGDRTFLIFLSVWLENAYSGPFWEFFFRIWPLNGGDINLIPKRHVLGEKITHKPSKSVKKDTERNPTVANWLFAQTTHVVTAPYGFTYVVKLGK